MTTRFWAYHWQNRYWRRDVNPEYMPVGHSAGNSFRKRGIAKGDVVYVISLIDGQLMLGGRMTVDRIINYEEAVAHFGDENFYEAAEHLIGVEGSGTPLNLHRQLSPQITKRLRFQLKDGPKEPFFVSATALDNQATRGIRELTEESALLLDAIIAITDQYPRTNSQIIVTEEIIDERSLPSREEFRFPEEVVGQPTFAEWRVKRVEVNRYERDAGARDACIAARGTNCCICGFNFEARYGTIARGYIHVHHLRPLSECVGNYNVDPVTDLLPVCPNCHAVLHLGGRCRTIDEVRALLLDPPLA